MARFTYARSKVSSAFNKLSPFRAVVDNLDNHWSHESLDHKDLNKSQEISPPEHDMQQCEADLHAHAGLEQGAEGGRSPDQRAWRSHFTLRKPKSSRLRPEGGPSYAGKLYKNLCSAPTSSASSIVAPGSFHMFQPIPLGIMQNGLPTANGQVDLRNATSHNNKERSNVDKARRSEPAEEEIGRLQSEVKHKEKDLAEKEQRLQVVEQQLASHINKVNLVEKRNRALEEETSRLQSELKQKDLDLEERSQRLQAVEQQLALHIDKVNSVEKRNHSLEEEIRLLQNQITRMAEQISSTENNNCTLEETINTLRREAAHWQGNFEQADKEFSQTREQWDLNEQHFSQRAQKAEQKAYDLQRQLTVTQHHLESSKKLLNERTDELKMVESFISRTNVLSGRELAEIVEALNQEIAQTCATILDSLDFQEPHRQKISSENRGNLLPLLEDSLESPFLERLARHQRVFEYADEEVGVLVALQIILVHSSFQYARSWCPSEPRLSQYLDHIYKGLLAADPFTAPRWRAMTHAQVRQRSQKMDCQLLESALSNELARLLNFCGWSDNYINGNGRYSLAVIGGLEVITKKILQLKKAINEDIVQDEAKLLWFNAGSDFNPDLATDDFSGSDGRALATRSGVLCTTDLGVQIATPRSVGNSVTMTLKAKVILNDAT